MSNECIINLIEPTISIDVKPFPIRPQLRPRPFINLLGVKTKNDVANSGAKHSKLAHSKCWLTSMSFSLNLVDSIIKALKPLNQFTDILSSEKYITTSSLLPVLQLIENEILVGWQMRHSPHQPFERSQNIDNDSSRTVLYLHMSSTVLHHKSAVWVGKYCCSKILLRNTEVLQLRTFYDIVCFLGGPFFKLLKFI